MKFKVSYGRHATDNLPTRHGCTFDELHAWLCGPEYKPRTGEKDGPYLVFSDFGTEPKAVTKPTSKLFGQVVVGYRGYSHFVESWAVPIDLDLGKYAWTADDIRARLAGHQFIAWTSFSHTPERPRWRIVVPTAAGMTAVQHKATHATLSALFLNDCGTSSNDATRLNYLPGACLHPEHAQLIRGDGVPFPVSAVPAGTVEAPKASHGPGPHPLWNGPTDDDELIAKALAYRDMKNPRDAFGGITKFQALWTGDAAYLGDLFPPTESGQAWENHSADLALANELAYLTGGDVERCVHLMGESALAQRDSWREDKGRYAVDIACRGRTQFAFMRKTAQPAAELSSQPDADPYTTLVDRTDAGNANLLIWLAQGTLRFVAETLQWLYWNARRWQLDTHEVFVNGGALEVGKFYKSKAEEADKNHRVDLKTDYEKWAAKCRNRSTLDNMITLARKAPGVAISVTELDRNEWLLGVENGVVDLKTGALQELEARDEYVTKRCAVHYDPTATCPRWEQFIVEITGLPTGDPSTFIPRPALARYLHKALGYSITGATREQKLFIAWGEGSNGKNGVFDAMKHLLGGYGRILPSDALMATARPADSERPTSVVATLAGARFVLASETKDGQTLDVGLIKNHTGDTEMTARRMRENSFTFRITHKLWISTNIKPSLSHVDAAIRGRLHLIPFDRRWNRPSETVRDPTIPDGDKTLPAQLEAEHEGILAWLVRGALLYQAEGLDPPPEVTKFTQDYIAEQDAFTRWLATMVRCDPDQGTNASVLYNLFTSWCVDEGMQAKPDNPTAFAAAMKKLKVPKKHEATGRKYGLRAAN